MAIAAALPGFNDLGRSVTPTFLSRNRFYSQLSPHCPKLNKKSIWEVLSTGYQILPSCGRKARETMVAKYELVLKEFIMRWWQVTAIRWWECYCIILFTLYSLTDCPLLLHAVRKTSKVADRRYTWSCVMVILQKLQFSGLLKESVNISRWNCDVYL